jgi:beta-lactamase regulating signal transducer with metallopeptidase domain
MLVFTLFGLTFNFSFASITMTILLSNLLIVLLYFLFRSENALLNLGFPALVMFAVFSILRLVFPFEIPALASNVYYPVWLSDIAANLQHPYFLNQTISIWNIFESIWLVGILVQLTRFIKSNKHINTYIRHGAVPLPENSVWNAEYKKIMNESPKAQGIKPLLSPIVDIPVIAGIFHPVILIPKDMEVSSSEAYYIFRHEISHYLHHDLILKVLINLICILYWWNPICALLAKQTNTLLEMRIDKKIASLPHIKTKYMECLLKVSEHTIDKIESGLTLGFCSVPNSVLRQRFIVMTSEKSHFQSQCIKFILFLLTFSLYAATYCYTFEPNSFPQSVRQEAIIPDENNAYFIKNSDGTYDFYLEDRYISTEASLEYYDSNINVYTSIEEANIKRHEKK